MQLLLLLLATLGLAQDRPQQKPNDKPQYTFGTTVVSTTGFQGRVYLLNDKTQKLPQFDRMKSAGTIYTNTLNVWPQRLDEGFPGITDRFGVFGVDYTARVWM